MHGTGRQRLAILLGAAGIAAALATTGCGSGGGSSSSDTGSAGGANRADQPAAAGAAEGKPAQPGAEPKTDLRVDQRAIVYTGSINIRVDDVDQAAARAVSIAGAAGGFVGGDTRSSNSSSAQASLQLRIPADKFASAVEEIAGLGRPERREINTQDVTEETLDLDARIATQRARVESGRRLLGQAKSLTDLVMLEGELAKREADLASLEAKKRRLADLTALSTITVLLLGRDTKIAKDEPATGFLAGLTGGWTALVATLGILLTVLGALLPWLVALGVPAVAVVWLLRRRRRPRPAPPLASAAAPAPSVVDVP